MKKLIILFAAIVMMVGFTATVMAQTNTSATTNTTAGAVLLTAMTIQETSPLHFGCMTLITAVGGTCVLNTSNSRTFSLIANLNASASNTPPNTNAAYGVTGTNNQSYALTLPATTTVTTSETGAVKTMDITLMTVKFLGKSEVTYVGATSTLSASGTDSFIVGGTLTVKANQIGGVYAGAFDVTVDYN